MEVTYAGQPLPREVTKTLFLAGPTPRSQEVTSWRKRALEILRSLGFDGHVFVPEPSDGKFRSSYVGQLTWEDEALNRADCILFWIPRDLSILPGFTTNHEHGEWFKSGKVILGAPVNAPKLDYLRFKAGLWGVPQTETLEEATGLAMAMIGEGAKRNGVECQIPLQVWNTKIFQSWYKDLQESGNVLIEAKVRWTFYFKPDVDRLFGWILWVDIFIPTENRHKSNEVVLGRPSGSAVLLYRSAGTLMDTEVVLVKEFRSPVSNATGYVWELPGGSSFSAVSPLENAVEEVEEETGLIIEPIRLKEHETRQIQGTLSAHKAALFSCQLTDEEIYRLRNEEGKPHGLLEATERTYVVIKTVGEIMKENLVDWACIGMILSVLNK